MPARSAVSFASRTACGSPRDSLPNTSQSPGANAASKALRAPLRLIARNAGAESSVVLQRVEAGEGAFGYDAAAGRCCDLYAAGIIDPVMVCRCALENAASVAGVVLTTEVLIADEPKPLSSPEQPR